MATTKIPNQGRTRQTSRSDVFGELTETFNIDLNSSYGKIKSSKRVQRFLEETADLDDATTINKILIWDDAYWLITDDEIWKKSITTDPTSGSWTQVSPAAPFPTFSTHTDAVIFGGNMLLSTNTNIAQYDGDETCDDDWWTAAISGTALTTGYPHILHLHRGGTETLFVTDNNKVRYYNSGAGHSTVTLQTDLVASCITSGVNAIWVGTYSETSGNAYVYEMYVGETTSGGTPIARNAYKIEGRAVLAIEVIDNVPHIVTETGAIQAFNGAGFSTVAEFPFVFSGRPLNGIRPGLIQSSSSARPVHPNGIASYKNSLYILINTEASEDAYAATTNSHSGIWEYSKETGVLHHRYGMADESTDYGAAKLDDSGPLLITDNEYTFFLAGCGTDTLGVYGESTGSNVAYFVTSEIPSDTITDVYERVYHKAKTLASGETIATHYRTTKRDTIYADINWVSATKFVTTDDFSAAEVGDLVRISTGYGAGNYGSITAITTSTSTYTVTIDRGIGSNGQTSKAYCDNFKVINDDYTSDNGEYKAVGIGKEGPWAQFMVIFNGDIEYREFVCKGNSKHEL